MQGGESEWLFLSGSDVLFLVLSREVDSVEFTELGGKREGYFYKGSSLLRLYLLEGLHLVWTRLGRCGWLGGIFIGRECGV